MASFTVAETDVVHIQTIAPYTTAPATLVTARSHLIDRFVPDCEIIALPQKEVAGGELSFGRGPLVAPADTRGRLARLRGARSFCDITEPNVIDLRSNSPQNWAHFLNHHLPIVFYLADKMDVPVDQILGVLPGQTPSYIKAAATFFGLRTLETDDILRGEGIVYDIAPLTASRPLRSTWVRNSQYVQEKLTQLDGISDDTPARVFLSRRGTRGIENEPQVAAWLAKRGFVTIYPEDLDVAGQLRLFLKAETIVAVHGAGLAPLLYVRPDGPLRHLVEIQPCGHMTDVYRVMAQQVGCAWIGVRGQIKPEYIKGAYNLGQPFLRFSLDTFTVDIAALEQAFDLAKIAG